MGIPGTSFIRWKICVVFTMHVMIFLTPSITYASILPRQEMTNPPDPSLGEKKKIQDTSTISYDGPHIFYIGSTTIIKQVLKSDTGFYARMDTLTTSFKGRHITCHVDDTIKFTTTIKKSLKNEPCTYPAPDKLLAISDIEGNFIPFRDLLIANGVMDEHYQWTFGTGHLVLNGDFFDRGLHVTECLWLIYHLEQEALKAKGYVHFILGNHEIMNMNADVRYVRQKYFQNTFLIKAPYTTWYTPDTELGRWLQTKNIVEKIGDYLFVHGGISTAIADQNPTIQSINATAREYYYKEDAALESNNPLVASLFSGDHSPFWYRGYTDGSLASADLNNVMKQYGVSRVVVGHSLVNDVSYYHNGKIIDIDTRHADGDSEGFLLDHDTEYKVDLSGNLFPIK